MTPWFRRVWSAVVVIGLGLASMSAWAMEAADLEPTGPQPWVLDDKGVRQPLYKASHALLISVSNYKAWPELRTTKAELDEVARELQKHGFRVRRVHDPSGDELKREVDRFFGRHGHGLGSQDHRLLFFFSGHGHTNQQSDYAYLVPMDAANPDIDPSSFYEKALPIDGLDSKARGIQVRHALFLFDSCFSGGIFASRSQDGNAVPQAGSTSERLAYLNLQRSEPVRQFIAAGKHDETVPARSQFTPGFLKALQGRAAGQPDGYVTGKEIGRWLEQTVPSFYVGGRDKPTHPHSGVSRDVRLAYGDMVFQIPGRAMMLAPVRQPEPAVVQAETRNAPPPADPFPPGKRFRDCEDPACPWMVVVPAGSFMMGSPADEPGRYNDEGPHHRVSISKFAMGQFEVTQGQWKTLMQSNPSYFKNCGDACPVENVSWNEAQVYVKKLNAKTGRVYRLPSEAEWEYAARAGTTTAYSFGATLSAKQANCGEGTPSNAVAVGRYPANPFGLNDMHGNVREWTGDWFAPYQAGEAKDPEAYQYKEDRRRVLRGGGWVSDGRNCRSARRNASGPDARSDDIGFRLARVLAE